MNIIDVAIVLVLVLGAVVGFKKGFTAQLVDTVGTILVIVISFLFKDYVSAFLYKVCPFFNFSGRIAGITALNLLLYEVLAFLILFMILSGVLRILKLTTSLFEKILTMTIVLGIPSKILGAIVGVIQNFIFLFVVLYVLNLPVFRIDIITESKLSSKLLNSTPFLSSICKDSIDVFDDFEELLVMYESEESSKEDLNQATLQLLIEKKIVSVETVNHLIVNGKLKNIKEIEPIEAS